MKYLRNLLLLLLLLVILGLVMGVSFLKKQSFQLANWEYPGQQVILNKEQDRPNILLLVAEDMSARVGAFGDVVAHTPNIDRLASLGVRYPNTFTTAGVCSPSRAALITGVHQISMGGQHMRTGSRPEGAYKCVPPSSVKAFPELLRQEGFFTFNTAKLDYQFSGALPGSGPFTIWDAENDTDLWRSREAGQPFFGMMNFMETHESGIFTPLGNKPNSIIHLFLQVMRKVGMRQNEISVAPEKVVLPPYYPNTPSVREDMARHYENIATMDAIVGDILDKLEKDGEADNTIIIWTTDHGDGLPRAKRELYDSGLKVPMVIYYPEALRPLDFVPGTVDSQLVSFVDLAPTILNLANTATPDYFIGQNILNRDSIHRSYIYASRDRIDEIMDRQRAVRNDQFKYIKSWYPEQEGGHHMAFRDNLEMMKDLWDLKAKDQLTREQLNWFQSPGAERLYDLKNDPFELKDISKDSSYASELKVMRQALENWLDVTEDWSDIPENEMVNNFQPNGITEITPIPEIKIINDMVTMSSNVEGASVGFRIDEGRWELYTDPFSVIYGSSIKAKAVRYGWEESDEVERVVDR